MSVIDTSPNDFGQLKVMAGIGFVCVQWALLEHTLLSLIAAIDDLPIEKAYRYFGSLDMGGRYSMAIRLIRDAKAPTSISKKLKAGFNILRNEKLDERRNQAVHGVHSNALDPDSVALTLVRFDPPKRTQTVSALDLYHLGKRLHFLTSDTSEVREELFDWKIRVLQNRMEHLKSQIRPAPMVILLEVVKNTYSYVQNVARYFNR